MRLSEHLTALRSSRSSNVCLVGENPTCSVPAGSMAIQLRPCTNIEYTPPPTRPTTTGLRSGCGGHERRGHRFRIPGSVRRHDTVSSVKRHLSKPAPLDNIDTDSRTIGGLCELLGKRRCGKRRDHRWLFSSHPVRTHSRNNLIVRFFYKYVCSRAIARRSVGRVSHERMSSKECLRRVTY